MQLFCEKKTKLLPVCGRHRDAVSKLLPPTSCVVTALQPSTDSHRHTMWPALTTALTDRGCLFCFCCPDMTYKVAWVLKKQWLTYLFCSVPLFQRTRRGRIFPVFSTLPCQNLVSKLTWTGNWVLWNSLKHLAQSFWFTGKQLQAFQQWRCHLWTAGYSVLCSGTKCLSVSYTEKECICFILLTMLIWFYLLFKFSKTY